MEAKGIECLLEVIQEANFRCAFHMHVVYIHFHVLFNLLGKHLVYKPLVCFPCVLQSKWHEFIAKESLARDK